MRTIYFISIIILLFSFAACHQKQAESLDITTEAPEKMAPKAVIVTPQQFAQAKMQLGQLQEQDFPKIITASGTLDVPPGQQAAVSVYAGGYVKNIQLLPGQPVRKGQRLFDLENPAFLQLQQEYLEAKAQLAYLAAEQERQVTLAAENIAAQKNSLKAKADYEATLARTEGLKARMKLFGINIANLSPSQMVGSLPVYAPISGYISEIKAVAGMFLRPEDVALHIINTHQLHVELDIFEKDILAIQQGQEIVFRVPDTGSKTYRAAVHLVERTLDPETRRVRVHGELVQDEATRQLLPGMYVTAEIMTNNLRSTSVPETALVNADETTYLLILTERTREHFKLVPYEVKAGLTHDGWVQILNPESFPAQDSILVNGAFNLIGIE